MEKNDLNKYKIPEELLGSYGENILNEEVYMGIAILVSSMSYDPSTQVGSCYVKDNRILSYGCNNPPKGWDKDKFPWGRDKSLGEINTKYPYIVHSEVNGASSYKGSISDLEGSTLYVTLFPCNECAKYIANLGIKKVIYLSDKYKDQLSSIEAKITFDNCGIEYIPFDKINDDVKEVDMSFEKVDNPILIKKRKFVR